MTSSENDLTSWFDSKLDDLQKQIDKLGKGDAAGAAEPDATAVQTTSAPAVRTSTRPGRGTPTSEVGRNGSAVADDVHEARNAASALAAHRRPAPTATPRRRLDLGGGYQLGVDVGGTFTDLLLIEEATGQTFTAKVPSTPDDSSRGVLNGIERICAIAGIEPSAIGSVMHGTTVATNTVLTGSGARVGLVTTKGYKQTLQIARSYVPGGLGGWVIFNKTDPLAPLELTLEADERMGARGEIVDPLNEETLRRDLRKLQGEGIEAMTVSLLNAYTNGATEQRVRRVIEEMLPGIPVSISSEVVPEMYEYERTETTVVNSYIRPVVSKYIENLKSELDRRMNGVQLHILRSDGGLASAEAAKATPVNLLMSGPAGGVSGAIWMAKQAGFDQLLTFDMGGTSTDVALIQDGVAQTRRETRVADVTVRASSVDVRTVGAGGGSIAYVPELTRALRVGPQSAGAEPGPAAYGKGGGEPTVTDANVVLGYLPANARLGGDMKLDVEAAEAAVSRIAKAMDLPVKATAEGIINIVNENMFGALRLVSVEKGFDPRDFALIGFGGAGPLHANALGKLMNSWPVIIPPGPGVLCAYGDATTRVRDEASRTFVRRFDETSDAEVADELEGLMRQAAEALNAEGVPRNEQTTLYQIDLRYHGQGMQLTVDITPEEFAQGGLREVSRRFDAMHEQLFTFRLDAMHESYNLRALVQGRESSAKAHQLDHGTGDPSGAAYEQTGVYVDGREHTAKIFDRLSLKAGDRITGPAVVTEMDSTTMILNDHIGKVDEVGNILITPASH
ncbi:MAG: hydantoinase/oxoprolinase family protein [Rhodospirillaceae bacterium]|nr:hydantoinase/oxoprolinase family protein [Rhodospirillaceae bacterium]